MLIVCYRSRDLIRDCLQSIRDQTSAVRYEVLLLDNSGDGTVDYVRREYPWVRAIEGQGNIGFGPGNNVLAEAAEGEYLLLLNPDTIVLDRAIDRLVSFARDRPEAGGWGGLCVLRDGSPDPGCFQPPKTLWMSLFCGVWVGRRRIDRYRAEVCSVPILNGAFLLISRKLWEQLEGFDESFFLYAEEADLCRRVLDTGRDLLLNRAIRITHLVGGDAPKGPDRLIRIARGNMHYHWKHYGALANLVGVAVWCRHATRWLGGWLGGVVIGRQRATLLRRGHANVVLHPSQWWWGWVDSERRSRSA